MPMDWRVFGQRTGAGLQQAGGMASQILLQDYARRLDEKYAKGMMDYQDELKQDQERREFKRRKKELDHMLENNKELAEWNMANQAKWKMFDNNPEWKAFVEKASSPEATDQDRANLTAIMSIRQRQALYLPLEKSHMDFLQSFNSISPGIALDLYAQEHQNQGFLKELEAKKALYQAQASWYGQRPDIERIKANTQADKASDALDTKIADKILDAEKRITQIEGGEDYQLGQSYVEKGLSESMSKISSYQKEKIRVYKSGVREIERLNKQIEIWESKKSKTDETSTEEGKTYTPADVQMIIEKDLIGAIVVGTKDGKPVKAIYRGNGKFEQIE